MIKALRSNKKIIINSDIDGVLSGLILQEYLDCEVVGFCNSDNKLWILEDEISDYRQFVFIDMFVNNKNITCIDQHIVSFNESHNEELSSYGNKINPNIIRGRYFVPNNSYYSKYPFGTVHFIIADLERNNFDLKNISLFRNDIELNPIEYFLRADDALLTSVIKYKDNALDWWKWLKEYSLNGTVTTQFMNYVYSGVDPHLSKKGVENHLMGYPFYCKKPDGGFFEILDAHCKILPNFKLYLDFIADKINLPPLRIKENFKILQGTPKRINFTHADFEEFKNLSTVSGKKVFSYAFVKSYGKENSFSFTYFLK
ncbi:hypothetical protein [Kaistella rhinocerotis]|uniref:hypothetical protein n=1 Tax=Kaistella rhinocerotis TaxID=3026437 RepID=UPI0025569F88|nr:hypothetical protein [Kaistella sp. Ran72]